MASIIITTGIQKGDYYTLGYQTYVIGRSDTITIQILDDRVSRRHMQICFNNEKNEYYVVDMNSKHGVYIDGKKINDNTILKDGDYISIGMTSLLFTLKNFTNRESAMSYLIEIGEWEHPTISFSYPSSKIDQDLALSGNSNKIQSFRRWAGTPKMTLVIVFTDIVDSTILVHKVGDERMNLIRNAHFNRARTLIKKFNGYEIKTIGDEFMVAFHTAVNALDFALEFYTDTGDPLVIIRVGVHVGPVLVEENDAQGATVSYASRVMSMAASGGVWISSEAKNHIDQEKAKRHESLRWQNHYDCMLKGFPGKHLLWSIGFSS